MENNSGEIRDVIFGEVRLAMDLWKRHPEGLLCEEAAEILATWAHAHRLPSFDDPVWLSLDALVRSDAQMLCRAAAKNDSPEVWQGDMGQLLADAEDALPGEEMLHCAETALELFARLDQAQLLAWAISRLNPSDDVILYKQWLPADTLFRENLLEFIPIKNYVSALADSYREDLYEFDPDLALVTAKYNIVLRECEENDSDSEPSAGVMACLQSMFDACWRSGDAAAEEASSRVALSFIRFVELHSGARVAAAVVPDGGNAYPCLIGNNDEWQARGDMQDGVLSFFFQFEGEPFFDGVFSMGAVDAQVEGGIVKLDPKVLCQAVKSGATLTLTVGDRKMPGKLVMEDDDGKRIEA